MHECVYEVRLFFNIISPCAEKNQNNKIKKDVVSKSGVAIVCNAMI